MAKKLDENKLAEQSADLKRMIEEANGQVFTIIRRSWISKDGVHMNRINYYLFLPSGNGRLNYYDITFKMNAVDTGEDMTDQQLDLGLELDDDGINQVVSNVGRKLFGRHGAITTERIF